MRAWVGDDNSRIHLFADPDALSYERIPWARETRQARLTALTALSQWGKPGAKDMAPPIVVGSVRALMQLTAPPSAFRRHMRALRLHDIIDLQVLLEQWFKAGYRRETLVEEPGAFSHRGGIIDIWPPNEVLPLRIELWGDEVDSLRRFDPSTQRTLPEAHPREW